MPAKSPKNSVENPKPLSSSGPVLVLRADAGVVMGTGHVMRCLALAQAWQDAGGHAVFAMADSTSAIAERLKTEQAEVARILAAAGSMADADGLAGLAHARNADWVVVDGYHLGTDYQCALKDKGCKILALDDYGHSERYVADLVLNQNAHASENFYKNCSFYTELLLGTKFVLLRREFRAWQKWQRAIPFAAKNILVTLGGSDPENVTARVLQAFHEVDDRNLDIAILAGGSNPHTDSLDHDIRGAHHNVRLIRNAVNMPELMAWADVAISGAGATCWEMCLLGLPAILIDVAPNQIPIAQELHRRGIAIHAGSANDISLSTIAAELRKVLQSAEIRTNMSRKGRELVDGAGALRVVAILRNGSNSGFFGDPRSDS